MLRIKLLSLGICIGICSTALGHPGHGSDSTTNSPVHYLTTSYHLIEVGLILVATIAIATLWRRLRASTNVTTNAIDTN